MFRLFRAVTRFFGNGERGGGGIIAGAEGTNLVGGSNLEALKRYF